MHLKPLLYAALLLVTLSVSTTYGQIAATGLVAHWRFNGNTGDSSGKGRHGTPTNITYGPGRSGKHNTAAYFDGSSSYVSVPYSTGMNLVNYTIAATVKLTGFYTGDCQVNTILQRGHSHTAGNYALLFADTISDCTATTADTNAYTLLAEAGPFTAYVPMSEWRYPFRLHSGKWYSMVATFNGKISYIYIDGKLVDSAESTNGPTPIGASNEGLTMGTIYGNIPGYPYWFKGYMDDVRIYFRALTPKEVELYDAGVTVAANYIDTVCEGSVMIQPYEMADTTTLNAGDTLIAELSDAAGSFATATPLGNTVLLAPRSAKGVIICSYPGTAGTGYRMRVATSNHMVVSPEVPVVLLDTIRQYVSLSVNTTNPLPGMDVMFAALVTPKDSMATYKWLKSGKLVAGATNDTLHMISGMSLQDGETVCVEVTSSYRCAVPKTVQACETIHIGSGISTLAADRVQVYPNPAGRQVTIAGIPSGTAIQLTDMQGRVLHNSISKEAATVINTASMATGVYILKLTGEDGTALMRKLVKD